MAPKSKLCLLLVLIFNLGNTTPSNDNSASRSSATVKTRQTASIIGTEKIERQIGMFYKLDLAKDNEHGPAMVEVMKFFDDGLRSCYTDRLEARPDLQGSLILRFKVSKDTGTMRKIKRSGGNINDKRMYQCLKKQLAIMPFDPPRDIRGTLYYRFGIF